MQVNGKLLERAHTCALLEIQVIQYKATQWLIWWRVDEWNLGTMSKHTAEAHNVEPLVRAGGYGITSGGPARLLGNDVGPP